MGKDGPHRAEAPLCSRTNGWSWPPHPFQLLAWLLYLYFAVTGFGVFVPLLPPHWIPAGYIVSFLPDRPVGRWSCSLDVYRRPITIQGLRPDAASVYWLHLRLSHVRPRDGRVCGPGRP